MASFSVQKGILQRAKLPGQIATRCQSQIKVYSLKWMQLLPLEKGGYEKWELSNAHADSL